MAPEEWLESLCESIEVGCRRLAARSLCKIYTLLCITGAAKRGTIESTTEAAERASRLIWIKRSENVGQCCWDTSLVLINPGKVA